MPEFEEVNPETNPQHNYVPSTDAKPRSRRRSGGFKKELSPAADNKIGEVDPAEMLQEEFLSGSNEERTPAETVDSTAPVIGTETNATDETVAPKPSAQTLAAIERVNARLVERKADRDAKYTARKKAREAGDSTSTRDRRSRRKSAPKRGFLAVILSIFGIGTKKPKSNRSKGRVRRPQGTGNNRSNHNRRRGGQNRGRQNYRYK